MVSWPPSARVYKDEDLAIQTQFHIAESHFELFKSHRRLKHDEGAAADLASGRRVLRELQDDYPNPKYAPRVSYLLGQFAQEMEAWDEAIAAYGSIVRNHPDHNLAPDSQYKLGQCHEEAGELDEALEAYVTLAGTYPKSPLIANVMLRINEHFYVKEDYAVAASVGVKFLERFPNHEWTPKMAFRIGQCHYKLEEFLKGGESFDALQSASRTRNSPPRPSSGLAKATVWARTSPTPSAATTAAAGTSRKAMRPNIPAAVLLSPSCWPNLNAKQISTNNRCTLNHSDPTLAASFFDTGALKLLLEGGPFMWPLLALLILAIAVIIERYRSLKLLETDASELREKVTNLLSEDKVEESLELCDAARGPVPAVLSSGLRKYLVLRRLNYDQAQMEQQVIKSMENYGVNIVAALEKHLPILATIASVAPMLGFLGTVQGMIVAFGDIEANIGTQNIVQAAASGIRVALLTTAFGLIVGIPAYMAFNYFTGIINDFVLQVESSAAELIEVVTLRLTLDKAIS